MKKTRSLDAIEIRVLGALMEKERTTPDAYPLTINGVISACNQKSNRDPVTSLTETEVVEALDRLRIDVLTWRTEGARVERWQHSLDRRWQLNSATKAVMCVLMLRGPQTPGELKTRCERMHHFDTKEDAEAVLRQMAEGFDALVRELPRQIGKRENRWVHLVAIEQDTSLDAAVQAAVPAASPVPRVFEAPEVPTGPTAVERLERLEQTVTDLQAELRALRERLGDLDE